MGFFDDLGGAVIQAGTGIVEGGLDVAGTFDDAILDGGAGDFFGGGFSTMEGKFGTAVGLGLGMGSGGAGGALSGAFTGLTIGGSFGLFNRRQARKATQRQESARQQSRKEAEANQNKLIEKNFRQRASSRGQGSSGNLAPGQQNASQQGTSLLVPQASMPSLFEGN